MTPSDNVAFHAFPPIRDASTLPREVLVVVAHPDDEVIGLGGLLAFHGRRGDAVEVVHATGGDKGDPAGKHDDIAAIRQQEVRAALAALELGEPRSLGFEDGALASSFDALVASLRDVYTARRPDVVYSFFPGEYHGDHRTLARACCAAREALPVDCRILLFGVNQPVPCGSLWNYSDLVDRKKAALACFKSQLAYLDFATKVMERDRAATVNVEDPSVTHAELLVETSVESWGEYLRRFDALEEVSRG